MCSNKVEKMKNIMVEACKRKNGSIELLKMKYWMNNLSGFKCRKGIID